MGLRTATSRLLGVLGLGLFFLAARVLGAPGGQITVYYYDPAAGIQTPAVTDQKIQGYLEKSGATLAIKTFATLKELAATIAKEPPDFVVVPPYLKGQINAPSLTPLLARQRDGRTTYEMIMVGPGKITELKGKTLAASGDAAQPVFLDEILLKGTGLSAKDLHVLPVGKDIDGVLAAGQGQAAVAAASQASVALVKKANPAVAGNLGELHKVSNIPFAVLFSFGSPPAASVATVKEVFSGFAAKGPEGQKILKLLKTDKWVEAPK